MLPLSRYQRKYKTLLSAKDNNMNHSFIAYLAKQKKETIWNERYEVSGIANVRRTTIISSSLRPNFIPAIPIIFQSRKWALL